MLSFMIHNNDTLGKCFAITIFSNLNPRKREKKLPGENNVVLSTPGTLCINKFQKVINKTL